MMTRHQFRDTDYLDHMLEAIKLARNYAEGLTDMAHGYFEINLDIIWNTIQPA